ncbi:hypothetical protein CU669_09075 [Paramagnetospirillum kuznetsovii]|uniref:DUF2934 domain-containing protein n=2 Tax=Paramagnetospirillum kuznetsovii TaxID=2053833 RepID=A0A364NYX2_9PROT|nr:hypothetical protein CU669_09075 [Paramagnetospirillum kuznetsovii]
MSCRHTLSLAETGALALEDAARDLDRAADAPTFLGALERNRRVWRSIGHLAAMRSWQVPNRRMVAYAMKTTCQASGRGGRDDQILALIDINRQVSAALAEGSDIEAIRSRAHAIWEDRGRPFGNDMDHWLLEEMEVSGT